jgi:hypothetical protein
MKARVSQLQENFLRLLGSKITENGLFVLLCCVMPHTSASQSAILRRST